MAVSLALPDGAIVLAVLRKDARGEYGAVIEWDVVDPKDDKEFQLARSIMTTPELTAAFDVQVSGFHAFVCACDEHFKGW